MQKLYNKPYCSSSEIINILMNERGFYTKYSIQEMEKIFSCINYFYLQRYKWNSSFYKESIGKYVSGHDHLESLLNRYHDDNILRGSIFLLINIVENVLRSELIEAFGSISMNFYLDANYTDHTLKQDICDELNKKRNFILTHFFENYDGTLLSDGEKMDFPPVWKAIHCLNFGLMLRMIRLKDSLSFESKVKKSLLESFQATTSSIYYNRMGSILWLRNCCAHFDHFIARSPQYYPRIERSNTNVGFAVDFVDESLHKKNSQGSLFLSYRNFAWYYHILYYMLATVIKTSYIKNQVNLQLSIVEKIVQKPDCSHLGFNFAKAKFII